MRRLLCFLGFHKWQHEGEVTIEARSKWEVYEVVDASCTACLVKATLRRDYYW